MGKKSKNNYFEMFVELVSFCCKASEYLHKLLIDYDPAAHPAAMEEMHLIEHTADERKHVLTAKLAADAGTPISRADILGLAAAIDNVTDSIEDVLLKLYMFNITAIRPDVEAFSATMVHCTKALKNTLKEFENYKKSVSIHQSIVEINRLEEEGDRLYQEAVHRLFCQETDPIQVFSWSQTYSRLERCCDACEQAANLVESVIMRNT